VEFPGLPLGAPAPRGDELERRGERLERDPRLGGEALREAERGELADRRGDRVERRGEVGGAERLASGLEASVAKGARQGDARAGAGDDGEGEGAAQLDGALLRGCVAGLDGGGSLGGHLVDEGGPGLPAARGQRRAIRPRLLLRGGSLRTPGPGDRGRAT